MPPLRFDDETFDLVYSLSIFSHLSADMVDAWLGELTRVTKPAGLVIVTFHGDKALRVIADSAEHQVAVGMSPDDAEAFSVVSRAKASSYARTNLG